jgi:hypothetical protein
MGVGMKNIGVFWGQKRKCDIFAIPQTTAFSVNQAKMVTKIVVKLGFQLPQTTAKYRNCGSAKAYQLPHLPHFPRECGMRYRIEADER